VARSGNLVDKLPVLPRRPPVVVVNAQSVLVDRRGGRVLGVRIPPGRINAGQVDLPGPGPLVSHEGGMDLESTLESLFALTFRLESTLGRFKHGITNHRIQMTVHWASCHGRAQPPLLSAHPQDTKIPWTTTARKAFALAGLARWEKP
jgi:hypothetical protein